MPLYDYECRHHGSFRAWGAIAQADLPMPCPDCGRPGIRQVSAPRLSLRPQVSKAHAINEKSANEPRVVRRHRGEPIAAHDAHRDLTAAGHHTHHDHGHASHVHGGEEKSKTLRSNHPWAVRH